MFSSASAALTRAMGMPSADRRVSSTSTWISSSRPPATLAAATPCSDSISFFRTSSATWRNPTRGMSPHSPMRRTGSCEGSYFRSTGGVVSSGSSTRSIFSRTSRAA